MGSRTPVEILRDARGYLLRDLQSTNGTFLGENQLTRAQPVELGQKIRIGKTVMELRP